MTETSLRRDTEFDQVLDQNKNILAYSAMLDAILKHLLLTIVIKNDLSKWLCQHHHRRPELV